MNLRKLLVGLALLFLLPACRGEVADNVSDFLQGCNSGKLNNDYPQSAEIDCLINLQNGYQVNGDGQSTVGVQFTPDGSELYTLSSGMQQWNVATWEEVDTCEAADDTECHHGYYNEMFYEAEKGVVGVSRNSQIYGGTSQNGPEFTEIYNSEFEEDPNNPMNVARTIYIPGLNAFAKYNHNLIRFFNSDTGGFLGDQEEPFGIQKMAGAEDYYALAIGDNRILVLPNKQELSGALLDGHSARVSEMLFSDDNTRLVSVDQEGHVIVWDVVSGSQIMQTAVTDLGNLLVVGDLVPDFGVDMALSADNKLLVIKRRGPTLTFINAETGDVLAETEMSRSILDLDISPDRSKLAIGYASRFTTISRNVDSNSSVRIEVEEDQVSAGYAVILDISGVGP
ncbi:MAG: WD40 repeat domain-containing protein [Chloroflexota bacterium]